MPAWTPTLPALDTLVPLAPTLGALVLGAFWLAGWLKQTRGVRTGYTRKLLHFVLFGTACFLSLTVGYRGVNLLGGIGALVVAYALWRGAGHPGYEAMARENDAPRRTLFIVVPVAATIVGGIASALLFGPFAAVGYLVAGCGDAIAEPVGLRFGRHPYLAPSFAGVRSIRTLEGSAAVLVVSFAVSAALLLQTDLPGDWTTGHVLVTATCIGCGAAVVEGASHHGIDNLTVQLAASGIAWALAPTSLVIPG